MLASTTGEVHVGISHANMVYIEYTHAVVTLIYHANMVSCIACPLTVQSSKPVDDPKALWLSADLPQQARELLCSNASCMAVQPLCSFTNGPVLKQQQATA